MTATRYDGTGAMRSAAITNRTSATAIDAYWTTAAVPRGMPAWYNSAPGVTLFGVVIGSVTLPTSVKKSDHPCIPTSNVAAAASTPSTIALARTADHRRVSTAQASTTPGWILPAAPSPPEI